MNVLIVGLGSIAKKHIAALQHIDSKIIIFALRSSSSAVEYEGVRNIFSLTELKCVSLDFAIISNPTAEHKKTIESLLPLNCPLFIEKPLYHTLEIEILLQSVKKSGVLTYVACNLRFLECIQFVKTELMKENWVINEVNVYCGSYLPEWRLGTDFRKNYSAIHEAGGGVHIDLIHELDYIYWLFGKPEYTHRIFRNRSSLNIEAYDYANYCLEYERFCANVVLNYYRKDACRTLEIVCDNGTWGIDLKTNSVVKNGIVQFQSSHGILDTYKSQMSYFVELVKNHSTVSFNSFENALDVLKICLGNDAKG